MQHEDAVLGKTPESSPFQQEIVIIMQNPTHAIQAYNTASRYRSQRDQEADVFRHATIALKGARNGGLIDPAGPSAGG